MGEPCSASNRILRLLIVYFLCSLAVFAQLDPHGATNMGNPIGGNVTSNISGQDEFYEEWMNYISYNQVCIRVCIAGSDIAPTPLECQHEIDELGCNWVSIRNVMVEDERALTDHHRQSSFSFSLLRSCQETTLTMSLIRESWKEFDDEERVRFRRLRSY